MLTSDYLLRTAQAAGFLSRRIRRTPLEYSPRLSQQLSKPIYLKLECLQATGSFKLRGAFVKLASLSPSEQSKGVLTCSAGNHGWALAYAGKEMGIPVTVYLPSSVDPSKRAGITSMGARVVVTEFPGFDDAEELARREAVDAGLPYVSAFEDPDVMMGNGSTLIKEVVEDLPEMGTLVTPVGGGGLAAGACLYLEALGHRFCMIGAQHRLSPALQISLDSGAAQTRLPSVETLAGGLEGGIGKSTFEIIRRFVTSVALLSEKQLCDAVSWMLAEPHYLIEPSAAAGVAAVLNRMIPDSPGPIVVIVTGRNLSADRLQLILSRTAVPAV